MLSFEQTSKQTNKQTKKATTNPQKVGKSRGVRTPNAQICFFNVNTFLNMTMNKNLFKINIFIIFICNLLQEGFRN